MTRADRYEQPSDLVHELARYGPLGQQPLALSWVAVRRDRLRRGTNPLAGVPAALGAT